ncbi:hypothetical protein ZIOFF_018887 [Zingiber officinale]|uniref:Uncharacterized protein n=1 Tax=Zingiber officinale TaxID=94328 RepID=A0A8J5LJ02_ZINOF|nr:hypothetical protein ZIOFF_018887 [Zingiber officinale]
MVEQPKLVEKEALRLTEALNKKLKRVGALIHSFNNYVAASSARQPHYHEKDKEIQSDEEALHTLVVLIERVPGVLAYVDEYTEEYEPSPQPDAHPFILVRKLSLYVILPQQKYARATGFDLAVSQPCTIEPKGLQKEVAYYKAKYEELLLEKELEKDFHALERGKELADDEEIIEAANVLYEETTSRVTAAQEMKGLAFHKTSRAGLPQGISMLRPVDTLPRLLGSIVNGWLTAKSNLVAPADFCWGKTYVGSVGKPAYKSSGYKEVVLSILPLFISSGEDGDLNISEKVTNY